MLQKSSVLRSSILKGPISQSQSTIDYTKKVFDISNICDKIKIHKYTRKHLDGLADVDKYALRLHTGKMFVKQA